MHRILGKHGISCLPANQKHPPHVKRVDAAREAAARAPAQLDVKFLERIPGTRKRLYQFTAIDDCTRIRVVKVYGACNQSTAIQFADEVLRRLPFRVLTIQTDNGAEFQSRFQLASRVSRHSAGLHPAADATLERQGGTVAPS